MDAIFSNEKSSLSSDSNSVMLNVLDEIDLKKNEKYFPLPKLTIYYTSKNIKSNIKRNGMESPPTWNNKFG